MRLVAGAEDVPEFRTGFEVDVNIILSEGALKPAVYAGYVWDGLLVYDQLETLCNG